MQPALVEHDVDNGEFFGVAIAVCQFALDAEDVAFANWMLILFGNVSRFSAKDGALYVTPNDEIEFGEKMIQLLTDEELREKIGRLNRARIDKELSWEHTSKELVKAYGSLLGEPSGTEGR